MTDADIVKSFRDRVCAEIDLEPSGLNRYIVYTPFMFDDGDHFVVVLRHEGDSWVLSDEGHTLMHLSYGDVKLDRGKRAKLIDDALAIYQIERSDGELRVAVPEQRFGDALFSFVQGIGRITAAALWTQDRVASTFYEDFRQMMSEIVPRDRLTFDYTDPEIDPGRLYPVDCRINGLTRPLHVFAVGNDAKAQQATITCYHYERSMRSFRAAAVFDDHSAINRKMLSRLSAVVDKQFPSLAERPRLTRYIREDVLRLPE